MPAPARSLTRPPIKDTLVGGRVGEWAGAALENAPQGAFPQDH